MRFWIPARCTCGALMVTMLAGGAAMHHDPHTHTDSPARAPVSRQVAIVSASTTAIPGGIVLDGLRLTSDEDT